MKKQKTMVCFTYRRGELLRIFWTVIIVFSAVLFTTGVVLIIVQETKSKKKPLIQQPPYKIQDEWKGTDMHPNKNKGWKYYTKKDPTNGYVVYGAWDDLLSSIGNKIRIDVQHDNKPNNQKRKSIRLTTTKHYEEGLFLSLIHI